MNKLLRKEFSLCFHASVGIYMVFAFFVLIPNYPYEIIFFFSAMSAFFICLKARETGDLEYTLILPVKRSSVPIARILFCVILQCIFVLIAGVSVAIKELVFPAEFLINEAGNSANIALIGWGFIFLGIFNTVFFPLHYRKPDKVGVPFLIAALVLGAVIAVLMTLNFALPAFEAMNAPDPENIGMKLGVLLGGMAFYAGSTAVTAWLSSKIFCGGVYGRV